MMDYGKITYLFGSAEADRAFGHDLMVYIALGLGVIVGVTLLSVLITSWLRGGR